ncbi:MAG: hypothetical protein KH009_00975 [Clostridiales bacterium]|nr:hypothetical protein [Clostridiales bacterium]
MKIYNRKKFRSGGISVLLAVLLLLTTLWRGPELRRTVLMLLLFLLGLGEIARSLSRELSDQDLLEEADERNRLISLCARSRSLSITQWACLGLAVLFLLAGAVTGGSDLTGLGVGMALAYSVSMLGEIVSQIYYENRL